MHVRFSAVIALYLLHLCGFATATTRGMSESQNILPTSNQSNTRITRQRTTQLHNESRARTQRQRRAQLLRDSRIRNFRRNHASTTLSDSDIVRLHVRRSSAVPSASSASIPQRGIQRMDQDVLIFPDSHSFVQPVLSISPNLPCIHCGSLLWQEERRSLYNCCNNGKHAIHRLKPIPSALYSVFDSNQFHSKQRSYNSMFAFSALGAGGLQKKTWAQPAAPTMLTIHGRAYHRIFDLQQRYDSMGVSNSARMYIYDGEFDQNVRRLDLNSHITNVLREHVNTSIPWAFQYRSAVDELSRQRNSSTFNPKAFIEFDQVSRVNDGNVIGQAVAAPEIAAIIYNDNVNTSKRKVVTYPMDSPDSKPRFIPLWSPAYESLQYPLLFLHGESGWSPGSFDEEPPFKSATMCRQGKNKVSLLNYCRQRILSEDIFMRNSRIAQEYLCDMYSRFEENTLNFLERSSSVQLRVASFRSVRQTRSDENPPGKLLPNSFHASPAKKKSDTEDALAIVNRRGKPHLFITVTTNPNWPEIQLNLKHNQQALDRPDLCCRVFKQKLHSIMQELKSGKVFGDYDYHLYVVEFQKRGLPHAHIVIKFKGLGPAESGNIDGWVWAQLPPASMHNGLLREKVIEFMIHKPCGSTNVDSPCMELDRYTNEKRCSKKYPQPFRATSALNDATGRVEYKRIQNGDFATVRQRRNGVYVDAKVDNSWVVPYNPYLLLRFNCHINVDIVSASAVVQYLFKYCLKSSDFARARVAGIQCEIEQYRSTRYISAAEACWRLLGFHVLNRNPSVTRVHSHLENEHNVTFADSASAEERVAAANSTITDLMCYFKRPSQERFSSCTLLDYFERYTVKRKKPGAQPPSQPRAGTWTDQLGNSVTARRDNSQHVCRIPFKDPSQGDSYYLRLLLHHVHARSFTELRTHDGNILPNFEEAAKARGLVSGNDEYFICMDEARTFKTGRQLRGLFVTLILDGAPASDLWNDYQNDLLQDLLLHHSREDAISTALRQIDLKLQQHGRCTTDFNLPRVVHRTTELERLRNSFNPDQERVFATDHLPLLTDEQRTAFDAIIDAVLHNKGTPFMLDAPAGTGKTFLEKVIAAHLRSLRKTVVIVASTGIAALQLPGGRTAHSTFKLPLDDALQEDAVCTIPAESERAQVLRQCNLIIWDELPMAHRLCVEALDRTLRDLLHTDKPFGGKPMLFSGDWRQIGPVIKFGSAADTVESSLISSPLWSHVRRFRLTISQRDKQDASYSAFVRAVGENRIPVTNTNLTDNLMPLANHSVASNGDSFALTHTDDFEQLVSFVYPSLNCNHADFHDRAILATTNATIDVINDHVLDQMHSPNVTFLSADSIISSENDGPNFISPEHLHNMSVAGIPPHSLRLKEGALAMIVRNLNFSEGLVNGQKCIVRGLSSSSRVLQVELLTPPRPIVLIPRIAFYGSVGQHGIRFRRVQFPIRVAYSLTINKSQGQTLSRIGLDLRSSVFAHGQLYVALSRAQHRHSIRCLLPQEHVLNSIPHTHNVVYSPFVDAATDTASSRPPAPPAATPALPNPPIGWSIVNEIGDGACLLRCIARRVLNDPEQHNIVRTSILQYISSHLYDEFPGSGGQSFSSAISTGINNEVISTLGLPPTTYHSVSHYLELMSHPFAYASHIEIAAAQLLYNITIRVTFDGSPFPPPPQQNTCDLLYHAQSQHYSTLRYHSP